MKHTNTPHLNQVWQVSLSVAIYIRYDFHGDIIQTFYEGLTCNCCQNIYIYDREQYVELLCFLGPPLGEFTSMFLQEKATITLKCNCDIFNHKGVDGPPTVAKKSDYT